MDVNGTRFHLIDGKADWQRCLQETGRHGAVDAVCDDPREVLTLRPETFFFLPRGRRDVPLEPPARRGAAFDRFGNAYWVGRDRRTLYWLPTGGSRASLYWQQRPPADAELAGLAVTEHHYLVVGAFSQDARHGLFVFDLHAGGEPLSLLFPETFLPFDLAPAPGGGVWVLDREHRTYWGLDRNFRALVRTDLPADEDTAFDAARPVDLVPCAPGAQPAGAEAPARRRLEGFPLAAHNPVSVVGLPDRSVLILDSPALGAGGSTVHHYRLAEPLAPPLPLPTLSGFVGGDSTRPVNGHDMAYVASTRTLHVVERDGNQAIAFEADFGEGSPAPLRALEPLPAYLPLHAYGSRALVEREERVFYDVGAGTPTDGAAPVGRDAAIRWAELRALDQPLYVRTAELFLPLMDGKEVDCVWHRLFLDACVPPETAVEVWTRAANDPLLVESLPCFREPAPYLRGGGSELPYHRPFPSPREDTGTWELLFQQARGRYLQVKLVLSGNGRATPHLHALRAYYPRFSYPRRYLPAVYLEDPVSAPFLERWLANPEGFYTEIEGKIAAASALFDARGAPPEALDWLAGWLGLVLDPLWSRLPARGGGAAGRPGPDRRRLFIRFALRLYDRRGTAEGVRFALLLLLDPCLERLLDRLRAAAVRDDPPLRDELTRLGLPHPTPVTGDAELEALLYDYLLAPQRPTKVRLVERFQTRQGRGAVAGDPTAGGADDHQTSAHRFSVLVPEGLAPEEEAMVERVVRLEKPAHTQFDVRRYFDYFRVGGARLGLDTVLGEEGRFRPMVLGRDHLAEGYLPGGAGQDVEERWVADRDLLGQASL